MIGMTALGIVSSGNSAWGVRSVGVWGGTSGQTREGHLVISSITGPSYRYICIISFLDSLDAILLMR